MELLFSSHFTNKGLPLETKVVIPGARGEIVVSFQAMFFVIEVAGLTRAKIVVTPSFVRDPYEFV